MVEPSHPASPAMGSPVAWRDGQGASSRFEAIYRLTGSVAEARAKAADICLEQTVELADELVLDPWIRDNIIGQLVELRPAGPGAFEATISFACDSVGPDLAQLLNVAFGNISLKPGIRLERLDLPEAWLRYFRGPRFGRDGWRALLGVYDRPILCAALKPMGSPPAALADLAYRLALGGIEIVKDDHGLADQVFGRFAERVERCAEAVDRANRETGLPHVYMPNLTGPIEQALGQWK